jgi:hypothetical protein
MTAKQGAMEVGSDGDIGQALYEQENMDLWIIKRHYQKNDPSANTLALPQQVGYMTALAGSDTWHPLPGIWRILSEHH